MTGDQRAPMRDRRIEELRDERNDGNGWFVYLAPGFHLNGQHCFGEENKTAVRKTMGFVKVCTCAECLSLKAEGK